MPDHVRDLQKSILRDYATNVGLDPSARCISGSSLRPLVPLDTKVGGFSIVGAYPSARFKSIDKKQDVPVGDNLGPFEPMRYFDGSHVRTQASADELDALFLKPLGITRTDCWITNLVKVFLFKPEHR